MVEFLERTPVEIISQLDDICDIPIPRTVENVEDMKAVSVALGQLGPLYAFLINMKLKANIRKRELKAVDKDKSLEYLVREDIFGTYADQVKMLYNTASRMVTIRQAANEELRMLNHVK